jgi:hypothetical protein
MRHYLEAGLLDMLWTELQHRACLRGGGRFREAARDKFFTLSVSHNAVICGTACRNILEFSGVYC